MRDAYRDANEGLVAKIRTLEQAVAERDSEIEELKGRAADQDAVLRGLKNLLEGKNGVNRSATIPASKRSFVVGAIVATTLAAIGGALVLARHRNAVTHDEPAVPLPNKMPNAARSIPTGNLCSTPGVKLSVDGSDAFAPASNERDLAGHKYRRGGDRSPWFTVNQTAETGPIYVHGVGGYLSQDLGTTSLSLLTIMTKGETDGYTLARGGKSLLEVTRSDGKFIAGRFEADMSKVEDTTREPPFGTPVVRVRGTFCLPALPANPDDTGP
jgi:hypothetical protein